MRPLLKTLFLVLAVLVVFTWAIIPPDKKLRRGKDLAGGVSMTYAVQIESNEDAKAILAKTIEVLKERVDPNGVMEISMVAQGRDRIEISMPLPSERVKALRKEFEDALAEIGRNRLTQSRLQQVMQLPAGERDAQIKQLSSGNASVEKLLAEAAVAFDAAQVANKAYEADKNSLPLASAAAEAETTYEASRNGVLATVLDAGAIRKVVNASTRIRMIDARDGTRVPLPSPREIAEQQLYSAHPESKDQIDKLLKLHAQYSAERTTLDDPQDLIRMLRGAGVLSFRIMVQPGRHPEEARLRSELATLGPRNTAAPDARWYRINQLENWLNTKEQADALKEDPRAASIIFGQMGYVVEPYGGEYYMLAYDTRSSRLTQEEGTWSVASATPSTDQRGRPAIAFRMDASGALLLGRLTGSHVSEPMGILLDDQVYTAPNLLSEISSNGQITGEFPKEELDYIIRVLGGGSLRAKLSTEPISINAVGPELGADNLRMGVKSGVISLILTAAFMIFYYFTFGAVALVALVANALCILGAMSFSNAAFTMPGIAGVILTFGMAVDSNVLVYERVREEINRGADLRTAVRLGFDKAFSAIVDGNITNLIVCVVLYYTGTPEIRGFAITMGLGVVSTLFAALVISKLIFNIMLAAGWRKASMLPMAVPQLQGWLTPKIDWIGLRYVFFGLSAIYVALGIGMVAYQGQKMLDNEFLGGTQVTLQFKPDAANPAANVKMTRAEVQARLEEIAKDVGEGDTLRSLQTADVLPINPDLEGDGTTSDRFVIKTLAQNTNNAVLDAVREKFADKLEAKQRLEFVGHDTDSRGAPAFAIEKPNLGANVDRPALRQDVAQYLGGVAIMLDKIDPPTTLTSLRQRLEGTRQSEQFSDTLARQRDVLVVEGDENAVTAAVIVVADETATISENEARWETEVRDREWALAQEALTKDSTPASVVTFSPAIADTFRANALAATIGTFLLVGVYIWLRFKGARYSIAAIVALIHDVLTVIGLIALAEILYESKATHDFAVAINLLPFKIDLNLVAALLTIAGYSLNDTVVIMDRIRENKGKMPYATRDIINLSINQTFSRTLITGGTTMASCLILYIMGGEGMRAFAFALLTGLIVGTYSSVAVAAPIVWSRKGEKGNEQAIKQA